MKNNCSCKEKEQSQEWVKSLGCWYVYRECEVCEYYWEGPIYLYDDPNQFGNTLE